MTDNSMTDERLDAIEAREREATKQPWDMVIDGVDGQAMMNADNELVFHADIACCGCTDECADCQLTVEISEKNALFIAHARADVPDLVKEVRRLRREVMVVKARNSDTWVENSILFKFLRVFVAMNCTTGDHLDSMSKHTYAEAMRFLAKAGIIEIENQSGLRVIGHWKKD